MATGPSQACLCTPTISLEGYSAKGTYQNVENLKIYVTGSPTSKSAIVFIYDAFGYSDQTLIAADLLSQLTDTLVIMPHILGDAAIPQDYQDEGKYSEDDKKVLLQKFMGKVNDFKDFPAQIRNGIPFWNALWPSIQNWAIFGLCFGGKVVAITSREGTKYVVSGQAHPSYIADNDPELITIPHIVLASKDEDAEKIAKYKSVLSDKGYVETYGENIHGFMGARADLRDPAQKAVFEKGYQQIAGFFRKYL